MENQRMSAMQEGTWNFYLCRLDGHMASIFLDLDARRFREGLPELFIIYVPLLDPNPQNGMSTNTEFQTLTAIEDELAPHLRATANARPIGRITTDGHRRFYYCAPRQVAIDLSPITSKFSAYRMKVFWQPDQWTYFDKILYPGEDDLQCMKNRDVLIELKKHGDKLIVPREITHWSYFAEATARDAFVDQVRAGGYRIISSNATGTKNPDDLRRFVAMYAKDVHVDEDSINRITLELFHLTKRYGGDYDGWETQVVK